MKTRGIRKSLRRLFRYGPIYLMLLPGFVYLIVNNYIPMAGIVIAFKRYNYQLGMWKSPWAGAFLISNFCSAQRMRGSLPGTPLLYNLAFIVIGTVLAIAVAILLGEVRTAPARKFYQTSILVPYLISMVIASFPCKRLS